MNRRELRTSFIGGEISPVLKGRIDLERDNNGAERIDNFHVMVQGGVKKSPGTIYVAATKDQTAGNKVRMIPFVFAVDEAYILEFGPLYIRIYTAHAQIYDGGAPVEVATPYASSEIFDVQFTQSGDILFLTHENHAPKRLERLSATNWSLKDVKFDPPASFEADTTFGATLTPGATTGNGVTFTASVAIFLNADVDRHIIYGSSRAVIRTVVGAVPSTQVTADILDAFPNVNPIAAGQWALEGSPVAQATPDKKEPAKATVTVTLDRAGFRSGDVGKYIHVHDGVIKVTGFNSNTSVSGLLLTTLKAVTATADWTLEVDAWSATRGYPRAVTLFEGRIWYGGSKEQPNTIWGSQTNKYENFAVGPNDDDGLDYTIASNQIDPIYWMLGAKQLFIGTASAEYIASGAGTNQPITPTSINLSQETNIGSGRVKAVRIGNSVVFVQRSEKKLYEMTFNLDADAYTTRNLTVIADHLVEAGIVDMAYQQEPDSIIWCVMTDGSLAGITFDRAENVMAWHRRSFGNGARMLSLAVIPNPGWGSDTTVQDQGRDEVWLVVEMTVGGQLKRFVCFMSERVWTDFSIYNNNITSVPPGGAYGGLSHLEGLEVAICASTDKVNYWTYLPQTVSGGQVIVNDSISALYAGLRITSKLITVNPEVKEVGTIQGKPMRWNEIMARGDKTILPFRRPGQDTYNSPPLPFTGDVRIRNLGYNRTGKIEITHDNPFSATILSLAGTLNLGDL